MRRELEPNFAIVSAWRPELEALYSLMPQSEEVALPKDKEDIKYYHGNLHGIDVVYLESGVGMTDSAISTSDCLNRYPTVKYLMVAGVGGALAPELELASITIPNRWSDYSRQLYARSEGDSYKIPGHMGKFLYGSNFGMVHPMKTKPVSVSDYMLELARRTNIPNSAKPPHMVIGGHGLSASIFLDNPEFGAYMRSLYPDSLVVDMESYAILRACQRHTQHVEAIAVRTISDTAGRKGTTENELPVQLQNATDQLTQFLDSYLYVLAKENGR